MYNLSEKCCIFGDEGGDHPRKSTQYSKDFPSYVEFYPQNPFLSLAQRYVEDSDIFIRTQQDASHAMPLRAVLRRTTLITHLRVPPTVCDHTHRRPLRDR